MFRQIIHHPISIHPANEYNLSQKYDPTEAVLMTTH